MLGINKQIICFSKYRVETSVSIYLSFSIYMYVEKGIYKERHRENNKPNKAKYKQPVNLDRGYI